MDFSGYKSFACQPLDSLKDGFYRHVFLLIQGGKTTTFSGKKFFRECNVLFYKPDAYIPANIYCSKSTIETQEKGVIYDQS